MIPMTIDEINKLIAARDILLAKDQTTAALAVVDVLKRSALEVHEP